MVSFQQKQQSNKSQSDLMSKAQSNGTTSAVIDVAEQPLPDILVLQEKPDLQDAVCYCLQAAFPESDFCTRIWVNAKSTVFFFFFFPRISVVSAHAPFLSMEK
jgi:hypothetical protein